MGARPKFRVWVPVVGVMIVTVVLIATFAMYRTNLGSCVMPDGTRLSVAAITYGKRHRYDDRTALERAMDLVRGSRFYGDQFVTDKDAVVAWVRVTRRPKTSRGGFHLQVVDEHGCDLGVPDPISSYGDVGQPPQRLSAKLGHLPFTGGRLRLEVRDETMALGVISIDTPSLPRAGQPVAKPLPQSSSADGMTITFKGVEREDRSEGALASADAKALLKIKPATGAERDWTPGWFALTDASGRRTENRAFRNSNDDRINTWFRPGCWRDPAWKLAVGVAPSPVAVVRPDREWRVTGVVLPGRAGATTLRLQNAPKDIVVESFETSGVLMVPKGKDVPLAVLSVRFPNWKAGGRITLDRVNGESVVAGLKRGGIRHLSAVESYCTSEMLPGLGGNAFLRFALPEGSKTIDLHLSGYRYKTVEFIFNPADAARP